MNAAVLFHWRRDMEVDVRIIMRAEGLTDLTLPTCKEWARQFIRDIYPLWVPGHRLRPEQLQFIGAVFESRLASAKCQRDKLAWQG